MEARQNDVESRTGDFSLFKTEQHVDSNEECDGPSYPCQPHSTLPDELLYRPHQLLDLDEEGSDDDDEIRVRDIPKPKQTAQIGVVDENPNKFERTTLNANDPWS